MVIKLQSFGQKRTESVRMGYQEALEGESNRTVFRKAEKKYKLYKAISGSVFRGGNAKLPIQDFSDVLDFHKIFAFFKESGNPVPGFTINLDQKWPVITLEDRPGFYFIPGALSMEEQFYWIKESLTTFPQPPNRTNHNQFQGPIHDLWTAAQNNKVLVEMRNSNVDSESVKTNDDCCNSSWIFIDEIDVQSRKSKGVPPSKSIPAKALLRKMRWATLGLQFDWSERNYDASLPHDEIPDALCHLAKELAMPAMHDQEFSAEAAIVNYFACDDTLGGHLDDMEKDWSKPIVSISLGCKAIFLLGGPSREDPPIAMFLRSGDAILMAGSARQCFHGVPRIFADENSGVPTFEKRRRMQDSVFWTLSRFNEKALPF